MTNNQLFKIVNALIAKGKTERVLVILDNFTNENQLKSFNSDITILQGRFSKNERALLQKRITKENYDIELNSIEVTALNIAELIKEGKIDFPKSRTRNRFIIASFLTLFIIGCTYWYYTQNKEITICSNPFEENKAYKILLFPFDPNAKCERGNEIYCMKSVVKRFNTVAQNYNVKVEIKTDPWRNINMPMTYDSAKIIGKCYNADLVIWGDYENKCEYDSTLINIQYAVSGNFFTEFKKPEGEHQVETFNVRKEIINEGKLTSDIEEIMFWSLGMRAVLKKDYKIAISLLEQINIKNEKEYAIVTVMIAFSYYALKDYQKAIKLLNKTLQINPNDAEVYYNRGVSYSRLKKHELGITDYTKALEINPNYVEAYYNRGTSYSKLKKDELAITDYNKAIEINPNYADAYNNRGMSYSKLKKHELAIIDYNKALELNPNDIIAYNNRGRSLFKLKKYDLAITDYNKVIELDPKYAYAFNNLALQYVIQKQLQKAKKHAQKSKELDPKNSWVYFTFAGIALLENNEKEFYNQLEIAVKKGFPLHEELDKAFLKPYLDKPSFKKLVADSI